jgi:hypothetical protein
MPGESCRERTLETLTPMESKTDSQLTAGQDLSSAVLFAVGDRVTAAVTLDGHPNDDWPLCLYASKGDELEIRECRANGWYVVAHPNRKPGEGFLAKHSELHAANTES